MPEISELEVRVAVIVARIQAGSVHPLFCNAGKLFEDRWELSIHLGQALPL